MPSATSDLTFNTATSSQHSSGDLRVIIHTFLGWALDDGYDDYVFFITEP